MPEFFSFISEILWGSLMVYLLAAAGIWFAFRSLFVPFRFFRDFGKSLKSGRSVPPGALTSWQALCLSLATRLGSGNLAGVAFALTAGGPGADLLDVDRSAYQHGDQLRRVRAGPAL